jgi:hypothetical protein
MMGKIPRVMPRAIDKEIFSGVMPRFNCTRIGSTIQRRKRDFPVVSGVFPTLESLMGSDGTVC